MDWYQHDTATCFAILPCRNLDWHLHDAAATGLSLPIVLMAAFFISPDTSKLSGFRSEVNPGPISLFVGKEWRTFNSVVSLSRKVAAQKSKGESPSGLRF